MVKSREKLRLIKVHIADPRFHEPCCSLSCFRIAFAVFFLPLYDEAMEDTKGETKMKRQGVTEQQANKIAWEAVLSTGNLGAHDAILNSILRAAGRK